MSESVLGGGAPDESTTDQTEIKEGGQDTTLEGLRQIYGDMADKIQWPEGLEDEVKLAPTIKQFVDKEGKLRTADALKSLVHAQKLREKKGVLPPTETSPKEEWDAYFEKVGFKSNPDEYDVGGKIEGLDIPEEFYSELKGLLHSNRIPLEAAKKIKGFFEGQAKTSLERTEAQYKEHIQNNIKSLKEEFGVAFNERIAMAKDFIEEIADGDEAVLGAFNDPALGSNPAIVKLVAKMAQRHYGEDRIKGTNTSSSTVSPDEAQEQINELMAGDIYWNPSHPQYKDVQKKVDRLYKMKNGVRA